MFEMKTTVRVLGSFVAVAALAAGSGACAAPADEEPAVDEGDQVDFTKSFSAEGLSIVEQAKGRVSGRFVRDGAALEFEFEGDSLHHRARITRDGGKVLMSSELIDGVDTVSYLDGRATVRGIAGEQPEVIEGDKDIFTALRDVPELRLIVPLKEALIAAGVERSVFQADTTAAISGLKPTATYSNGWWYLKHGDSFTFMVWSWWATTVTVANANNPYSGYYSAYFHRTIAMTSERVSGYGTGYYARQWIPGELVRVSTAVRLCAEGAWCPNFVYVKAKVN